MTNDQKSTEKPKKLFDLKPITRRSTRDFSHMERDVEAVLQTDDAQRFVEQYVARCLGDFKYLGYTFINMRDDEFARPLCDEITKMLMDFESQVLQNDKTMKQQLDEFADSYPQISQPRFDNTRAYRVVISSFHASKMMTAIRAMDNFFVTLKTACLNGLIDPFQEADLRRQWVDQLKQIRYRVSAIVREVRQHTLELREKRQKEAQERAKQAEAEQRALEREKERRKQLPVKDLYEETQEPKEEPVEPIVEVKPELEDKKENSEN